MGVLTTAVFRMLFSEQVGLMRNAVESLGQRIPEVEENHHQNRAQGANPDGVVRQKASMLSSDLQTIVMEDSTSMILWLPGFTLRKRRKSEYNAAVMASKCLFLRPQLGTIECLAYYPRPLTGAGSFGRQSYWPSFMSVDNHTRLTPQQKYVFFSHNHFTSRLYAGPFSASLGPMPYPWPDGEFKFDYLRVNNSMPQTSQASSIRRSSRTIVHEPELGLR
jgi:hypothetical protein